MTRQRFTLRRAARWGLAIVLAIAGVLKLLPESIARSPSWYLAIALVELVVAAALVVRVTSDVPALLAGVLVASFTVYLAVSDVVLPPDTAGACGCMGPIELSLAQHATLNGVLLILTGLCFTSQGARSKVRQG